MATRKTSKLAKSIETHLYNVRNTTTDDERQRELAALGGVVYANRRQILRALARPERGA